MIITHRTDDPAKLPPVISAAAAAAACTSVVPYAVKAKTLDPARPKLRLGAPAAHGRADSHGTLAASARPETDAERPGERRQPRAGAAAVAGAEAGPRGGAAAEQQAPAAEGRAPAAAHSNGAALRDPTYMGVVISIPVQCSVHPKPSVGAGGGDTA